MAAELALPLRDAAPLRQRLAEGAFLVFLLLIFVTLQPFAARDALTLSGGESGFVGAGDVLRQVAYLGAFALVLLAAVQAVGWRAFTCISPVFALLLAWCTLSALWAAAPDVTFRRAVLEVVIVLSALMGVAMLGPERSLALLRGVLGAILIVNWISIRLVHNAVHLPGETDPQLVGAWRGLFFHKNIAGSVSAITAILFFFEAWTARRLAPALLCAAAVAFTVMTHSKSSLGFLALALAVGSVYRLAWHRPIDRAIVMTGFVFLSLVGAVLILRASGLIAHALSDPTELTGRTAIWQGEIAFIQDHWQLGSGFGSFADTGAASPLRNYVGDAWVQNESHGHNAYLQLLVTIGVPGFMLAMIAFVLSPLGAFLRADPRHLEMKAALFAVFTFMVLHNVLESDFLEGEGPAWVAFLIVLGAMRELRRGEP